ncbi:MAG: ribonuclease P protein component [bacterium]|nr:ribonuclease P protein component [bacterium]
MPTILPTDPNAPATLPARCRLKSQRDFRRVYRRGQRARGEWLTVVGLAGREPNEARVGLSVAKVHGRAVRRNKLKRLLREAFRRERHRLPTGLDVVLIPQQRPDNFPLAELRVELVALIERVLRGRTPRRGRAGGAKRSQRQNGPAGKTSQDNNLRSKNR